MATIISREKMEKVFDLAFAHQLGKIVSHAQVEEAMKEAGIGVATGKSWSSKSCLLNRLREYYPEYAFAIVFREGYVVLKRREEG